MLTSQEVSEHYLKGTGVAAPTAAFTSTTDDLEVSVNGSTSSAPPGRTITAYSWNWGDGTAAGSGVTATHPYANGGTYTVTLTVTDSLGLTASTSKNVTVAPPHANPTAAFGTQVDGLSVAFDGTTSTAADGATIASYAWNFGDGDTSTQPAPSHPYDAAGTYNVTLTVVDSLGASDSVTQPVTVAEATTLAADEFQRTSASGWGTADAGGSWSAVSGSSVDGSVGLLSVMNSQTRATTLSGTLPAGTDARVSVSIDKVANGGGAHVNVAPRKTAAGEYRAKLRFSATGVVNVSVARLVGTTETLLVQPDPHRVHAHRGRHPRGAGAHGEHGSIDDRAGEGLGAGTARARRLVRGVDGQHRRPAGHGPARDHHLRVGYRDQRSHRHRLRPPERGGAELR